MRKFGTPTPKDTTLTPLAMVRALGRFALDPCAFQGHKTADNLIVLPKNGLEIEWKGRVWLNPPYSRPHRWLAKMVKHRNGIALVLASVEAQWFHQFIWNEADGVFFQRGRPKFLRADKTEVQLMRPTCLVAYGKKNSEKLREYAKKNGGAFLSIKETQNEIQA